MWNPWRTLRELDHIEVIWEKLPDDLLAVTDGKRLIIIDPRQRQAKRRSTIAHELAHIVHGHVGGCSSREERVADEWAARKLIKLHHLADAAKWAMSTEELADELLVDHATLTVRLETLTNHERAYLEEIVNGENIGSNNNFRGSSSRDPMVGEFPLQSGEPRRETCQA